MKKIAHRIDEYFTRLIPPQRLINYIRLQSDSEIVPVSRLTHRM
jgi:hypothetical protein